MEAAVKNQALQVYALEDRSGFSHLGHLGEIWLRSIGPQLSNLRVILPNLPSREETLLYMYEGRIASFSPENRLSQAESQLRQDVTQQLSSDNPAIPSWFQTSKIEAAALQVVAHGQERLHQNRLALLRKILSEILDHLHQDGLLQSEPPREAKLEKGDTRQPGSPGLSHEEIVRRLARALWAE